MGITTAMLVNTEAVMNARVTTGTSKYHASKGSLAAPSMTSRMKQKWGSWYVFPGYRGGSIVRRALAGEVRGKFNSATFQVTQFLKFQSQPSAPVQRRLYEQTSPYETPIYQGSGSELYSKYTV
jgi:hypothetical protein